MPPTMIVFIGPFRGEAQLHVIAVQPCSDRRAWLESGAHLEQRVPIVGRHRTEKRLRERLEPGGDVTGQRRRPRKERAIVRTAKPWVRGAR
jgi:hypothetical protein